MTARGALIKPWLFREISEGYRPLPASERLDIYRRYVALALQHWREDERGREQVRQFTVWHLNFWCRYAPRRPDGSWPSMQTRESDMWAETPLDRLLARSDEAAHAWIADRMVAGEPVDPDAAPQPSNAAVERSDDLVEAEG
jgi:tRNA-dihydrouridine synthase 3